MLRAIFFALTLMPGLVFAGNCKVISVSDGDTFTCFTDDNEQIKVRLAEIDAPEMGQPYGSRSKQILSDLIYSEMVRLDVQDTDQYGRTVARVTRVDGLDVNARQVTTGAAWAYRKYLKDKSLLVIEAEAKNSKQGLWALSDSEQIPPWDWRGAKRAGTAQVTPVTPQEKRQTAFSQQSSAGGGFNCNVMKRCGAMNCAEAQYQLKQCRNPYLDGDGDGRPCERQCGH
jgi:endonuclease YncB( thermonuclease family)